MEKEKKTSCKADLKREVKEIVDNVEGYTKEDKIRRRAEVKAAFAEKDTKKRK